MQPNNLAKLLADDISFCKDKKSKSVFRAKSDGDFIVADSGKTVWSTRGAAKNAIGRTLKLKACRLFCYKTAQFYDIRSPKNYGVIIGSCTPEEMYVLREEITKELWKRIEIVEVKDSES